MKNSFLKKVSAVSAVAILSVSVAPLFTTNAQDVGYTVLSGAACVEQASPTTFDVNFGEFSGGMVVSDQYEAVGTLENNVKSWVATRTGTGAGIDNEDIGTGQVISVLDTCGNDTWTATVQFSTMSGQATNFSIHEGAIAYNQDNVLHYLGTTQPLVNSEVSATPVAVGGDNDGNDDYVFNGTATPTGFSSNPWSSPASIIVRSTAENNMAGEFGVRPDISIFVPQYQPSDTYEGDIIVDMVF